MVSELDFPRQSIRQDLPNREYAPAQPIRMTTPGPDFFRAPLRPARRLGGRGAQGVTRACGIGREPRRQRAGVDSMTCRRVPGCSSGLGGDMFWMTTRRSRLVRLAVRGGCGRRASEWNMRATTEIHRATEDENC